MFKDVLIIYAIILGVALVLGIIVSIFDKSYKKHIFFSKANDEDLGNLDDDEDESPTKSFDYNFTSSDNTTLDEDDELGAPISFDPIEIEGKKDKNKKKNSKTKKDEDNVLFGKNEIDEFSEDSDEKFDDFYDDVDDKNQDLEDFDEENDD